jgi:predicted RNA-binding Zn-ribbon protein involved in translation (DUF1610 family)
MTNTELLFRSYPDTLLTAIQVQMRFILRQAAIAKPCPNCGRMVNQFDAAGLSVDEFDTRKAHSEYRYECPACKRELAFTLPLSGGWVWRLVPAVLAKP